MLAYTMTITVLSHYYDNPSTVQTALERFAHMADVSPGTFDFLLVDDHCPHPPPKDLFAAVPGLRVFRLREDVPWNMAGARNVGFHEARGPIVVVFDIDHFLARDQIAPFLTGLDALRPGQRAHFPRFITGFKGGRKDTHSAFNIFAMHRSDFWQVGGYEEAFAGHYGQEDKYFLGCCRKAGIKECVIEAEFEVQLGAATPALDRDTSVNLALLNKIWTARQYKARKTMGFAYDQIH